ncbi:hypothetical protein BaRGS_00022089 [Batillaria attramentaria]|uniref:Dihydrolipoamide acetyltransferase component of pyruvate dehydrogenase complex n=1 Tax=Batillaria attramentaria TaxID=370345 RepID=A0ABD0KI04_9CAEN
MSATGGGGLGRMSSILNGLRLILSRTPVHHAAVRHFYLQRACEAVHKVEMPSLSPTMEMGTIVKWHKKEGDTIVPGDVLCDIQTDKAVVSMEYEDEGVLAKILKPDNSADIKVGALIALMVDEGDDWKGVEKNRGWLMDHLKTGQHLVGPSVRKLLEEYRLSIFDVPRSGPKGSMLKGDVLGYLKAKGLPKPAIKFKLQAAQKEAEDSKGQPRWHDMPLSTMRKTIAKRLTESKTTVPHAYAAIECSTGPVTKLRKKLAGVYVSEGVKVSMNDFIIKAAGYALEKSPRVNAVWQGKVLKLVHNIDISIAVATENGLITPIVTSVPLLSVAEVSAMVKDLAKRAREGKLKPEQYQGGTFTISNLGMYGIKEFSAIINLPQIAIMAVGGAHASVGENNAFEHKMTATLSFDCRAIDETEATRFLEAFRSALENPDLMMVGSLVMSHPELAVGLAV